MAGNSQTNPDGAVVVPVDPLTGLLTKALEVAGDVAIARHETSVTPQPVTKSANSSTTPPPPAAPGTPPGMMSTQTKILIAAGAAVALLAVLYLARRK